MAALDRLVIVGAAHSGGRAAQAARAAGFDGSILLVGAEPHPPYERPPLSKQLITGEEGMERVQLHPPDYYPAHDIELRLETEVTALDAGARRLTLDGRTESYDRLILATGARVRRLPLPGEGLAGVVYLRSFEDSRAIKAALGPGRRLVVVGGGFIGLEIAASARTLGAEVTVIEVADQLMGRAVAPEIGAWFAALHGRHGVDVRLGAGLAGFEGAGALEHVVLTGGERIAADMAVIGIGIQPNVELGAAAGLAHENGIVVDRFCRTSDPDIWAAGDVANQPNRFLDHPVRLESYQNAQDQGMAAGRNAVGAEPVAYNDRLWVWTDQYDVNLQMIGLPRDWDRLVIRGDADAGPFTAFYLREGRIVGVNLVNNGREVRTCERLFASGQTFPPTHLADPATNLRKLLQG